MAKVWFELNTAAVRNLLRSDEVMDVLKSTASEVANRTPGDYNLEPGIGRNRAHVKIVPADDATVQLNREQNVLLKSIKQK